MGKCEQYIDDIDLGYDEAYWSWYFLENVVTWMDDWYEVASEENWRINVKGALRRTESAISALLYGYSHPIGEFRVPYYLRYCVGGNGVDMDAILSAMITADFDQLQKFTGLIDAYRVALWNEPFNADFYAALARGFTP